MLEAQNVQNEVKQDPNTIQINDLQKIKGLELQDRYNVLETLVKELIGMRAEQQEQKKRDDGLHEVMLQQMQMMMQMMAQQSQTNQQANHRATGDQASPY